MFVVYFVDLPENHPAIRPAAIGVAFASPTPWGDLPWVELTDQEYQEALAATVIPPGPAPASAPDWEKLEQTMRGSLAWGAAYLAAAISTPANAAFTLILATLTTTHNLADLRFGWEQLRSAMQADPAVLDFSQEQLNFVRDALTESGFNPSDFSL